MSEDQTEDQSSSSEAEDKSQDPEVRDNMNLFASVWVKVEVNNDDEKEPEQDSARSSNTQNTKRGPYKKSTPESKKLKCDLCDYRTKHRNCLKLHIMNHTNPKPYTCDRCNYKTMYPMSLKRHIFVKHEETVTETEKLPTFHCSACSYETHFKWNLRSHERKHDLTKQHKCPHCNYSTAYKHSFKKHSRTHNKPVELSYFCDKCPFKTKYEGHIVRHMAKFHFEISDKARQCEHCSFTTKTGWRLNIHVKRSRQEQMIKCVHCEYQTLYRCAFREHKVTHIEGSQWLDTMFTNDTNIQPQNIQEQALEIMKMCEIRSKIEKEASTSDNGEWESSKIYSELKRKFDDETYYTYNESKSDRYVRVDITHMTEHKNNHYLLDPTCDVAWNMIQVIESPDQDRPFQCTTCNYSAKFKASVQRHFQRHHTSHNRPYRCMNCDFSTKTKDQIALHNKRSKSDEILTCKVCGFTSIFKCQYAMHEKEHHPFKCVHCDYTCKKKPDIQKHFTIVHLGLGLKCSHCDFKAMRKESLLSHEVIHTGIKPFQCKFCGYSSVRRLLLENHMHRFHRAEIMRKKDGVEVSNVESLRVVHE